NNCHQTEKRLNPESLSVADTNHSSSSWPMKCILSSETLLTAPPRRGSLTFAVDVWVSEGRGDGGGGVAVQFGPGSVSQMLERLGLVCEL
ncbi:hypothetical protein KUCAC02_023078, partial [Chaenocephalus aceratus]